jgi:hypothetical protein
MMVKPRLAMMCKYYAPVPAHRSRHFAGLLGSSLAPHETGYQDVRLGRRVGFTGDFNQPTGRRWGRQAEAFQVHVHTVESWDLFKVS